MTVYKHFDEFGTGTSLAAYWDETGVNSWSVAGGGAIPAVGTHHAVHTTDAGVSFPNPGATFTSEIQFRVSSANVRKVGVTTMGTAVASAASSRLAFIWTPNQGGNDTYKVTGPGININITDTQAAPIGLGTYHRMSLAVTYAGSSAVSGTYLYDIKARFNARVIVDTQVAIAVPGVRYPGFMAERTTATVSGDPFAGLAFIEWFRTSLDVAPDSHEPKPTLAATVSRTPITPGVEDTGTAATVSVPLKVVSIRNARNTARFLTESGYSVAFPRDSQARRSFECVWMGDGTTKGALEAFFEARMGTVEVFTTTIRSHGIGTVDVFLASDEIAFTQLAQDVWRTEFVLVEVI